MNNQKWIANVAMLCPVGLREFACVRVSQFTENPQDNTPNFWSVPIYDNQTGDLVYYLAHSRIQGVVLQYFPTLQLEFPGTLYILTQHDDYPDAVYLTIEGWLNQLGLHLKVEDEIEQD